MCASIPRSPLTTINRFLKKLGLTTLETRRPRGDLIQVFKILKGYDDISENIFCSIRIQFKRSSIKVTKKSVRLDIAKYYFSNRVL